MSAFHTKVFRKENSEIGRRLLESSYKFKKSNEHERQPMCSSL